MTHRPLPAALKRRSGTSNERDSAAPGPTQPPPPLILYLAVPHPKLLDAIRKSRVFTSHTADRVVELRAFYADGFPNLPADQLRLLGGLTQIGEVDDLPLATIQPEKLP